MLCSVSQEDPSIKFLRLTRNLCTRLCLLLFHHIILNLETLTPWKILSFEKLTVTERSKLFAFLRPMFRNFHSWSTSWTKRNYFTCWQCIIWISTFSITIPLSTQSYVYISYLLKSNRLRVREFVAYDNFLDFSR